MADRPGGLDEDALRRALRGAGLPDASVRYEDTTDSTNAVALRLAGENAPEWTLVAAGHQTAGRGRLGREWVSEPGASLLCSFVLRPPWPPDRATLLTLLAGAAMAEAAREHGATDAGCKWPNDLLVGDRKAGGILAEAEVAGERIVHVVVGVGVNLDRPPPGVEGAAGLGGVGAEALLTSFLSRFASRYRLGTDRIAEAILEAYRPLCATLGRTIRATTIRGETVEGLAMDLDPTGGLLVDGDGGTETVAFAEVQHLR
jgi:BirA family biotin operon repressor/biotin-[acetyl-CoA-carboxylase] ligase